MQFFYKEDPESRLSATCIHQYFCPLQGQHTHDITGLQDFCGNNFGRTVAPLLPGGRLGGQLTRRGIISTGCQRPTGH
eukprot:8369205-Pyramimonas_sp.AAC.1